MIQLFYVVWAVLAVIVAAAFTWVAFKPQPVPSVHSTKSNKPVRKPRTPQVYTVNPSVRNAPETPVNDEELLQWSAKMQQSAAAAKPTAKVDTTKPVDSKKETKAEKSEKVEKVERVEKPEKAEEQRKLEEELRSLSARLHKVWDNRERAALHSKQSKDDIAKQEKANESVKKYWAQREEKVKQELEAVKSDKNAPVVSSRDSLNLLNYAKNTESTLQTRLDALVSNNNRVEEEIKAIEEEIRRLESGQDPESYELEAAIQLNHKLEQENKELRDRLSLSQHVSASSDDVKQLTDALAALREELAKANKDLQALTTQHQETKDAVSKARADKAARSACEEIVESLTSQLDEVEKVNKGLASSVQKERLRISSASTTLVAQNKDLKEKIAASTQEIENLKNQIEQVQNELSA